MRRESKSEGLRWLEQAEADRKGAQLLFDGGSYHLACFVGQQVAEEVLRLTDQVLHLVHEKLKS